MIETENKCVSHRVKGGKGSKWIERHLKKFKNNNNSGENILYNSYIILLDNYLFRIY